MTERYNANGEIRGFIVLNVEQDQYNEKTDNATLQICDYFVVSGNPEVDNPTGNIKCDISYVGDSKIKAGGSYKRLLLF